MKDEPHNIDVFVSTFFEDGKKYRLGHAKVGAQLDKGITRIAKKLKTNKSILIRAVLESYVKFFEEREAVGGQPKYFDYERNLQEWITERFNMSSLNKELMEANKMIQDNSKSPEVKYLSKQMVILSKMVNEVHKNHL